MIRRTRVAAAGSALLLAATVLPAQAVPTACADADPAAFGDVAAGGIFEDAIECAAGFDLVGGFGDGTFRPGDGVTRGQAAAFVANLIETAREGEGIVPVSTNPFTDVSATGVFGPSILKLVAIDVVDGTTPTTYEPGALLTRGQMAAIVVNALEYLGLPLNGSDAGFSDVGGLFAVAINKLANAGIVQGITATTYGPGSTVTRGQLASFTAESIGPLDAAGLWTPPEDEDAPTGGQSGSGTVVAATDGANSTDGGTYTFVNSSGVSTVVTYDNTDTFTLDGAAANEGVFEARVNPGDTVVFGDDTGTDDADTHTVTNRTVLTGRVGQVDITANTFQIIEPFTGTPIGDGTPDTPNDNDPFTYAVDGSDTFTGSATNFTTFEANIQVGDTVTVSDDDDNNTYDDFALSNATFTGTAANVSTAANIDEDVSADAAFTIGAVGDVYDDALALDALEDSRIAISGAAGFTQTYTLNGTGGASLAAVVGAISNGDTINYSRSAGTETFTVTDSSPVAVTTAIVDENTNTGATTLGYISGSTQATFNWGVPAVGAGQLERFFVDGVEVLEADFIAALSVGDAITIQDDDADTDTDQVLRLTSTDLTGTIRDLAITDNDAADETFDVTTSGGLVILNDLDVGAAFTGGVATPAPAAIDRYFVNNAEVSYATFESYLVKVAADASPDDTVRYDADNGAGASILYLTTDETI